ncbi:hypothetical protein PUNSTDRAFT_41121 [Punctularia strigosozonata HHB-11173 SS5]|uniref:uncharacterized protein n=1 Tax=Punctularia strigosozonata (strain HHB-11173) TaxID=741275 RepID=UPI0004417816|nr:uncharacterized protein PUNSTDRAFT_41121 [Punctularia strigosozonata HHB-11173 SS5]EIN13588.1 hypothetical protein PUNSTDRAFT_41121 [Punctularia strigosozonata HHB-11173 SS5]
MDLQLPFFTSPDLVSDPLPPSNHLWLVWYYAPTALPKHWALILTYEADDESFGTSYQVEEAGTKLVYRKDRGVPLQGPHGIAAYDDRLLLGMISDRVLQSLDEYCETATSMINECNEQRDVAQHLNSVDWCLLLIRCLEDSRFIPRGALEAAEGCPRVE